MGREQRGGRSRGGCRRIGEQSWVDSPWTHWSGPLPMFSGITKERPMRHLGVLRDACPRPAAVGHLGHHTGQGGSGGTKLSAEVMSLGSHHLSTCSLSFRRWAEVVQCRVPGMLWGAGLRPLCPHSQPRSNLSHCREKFLLGQRSVL